MTAFLLSLWMGVFAAEPISPINVDRNNVAVKGTDVVAYFEQGQPVAGSATFTAEYMGATWRFSTAAHRDAFAADPARYAPQYGGYCAWAVAQGYTAKIDPRAWRVVDDKLYLNYNLSIRKQWDADRDALIAAGNQNWPKLLRNQR